MEGNLENWQRKNEEYGEGYGYKMSDLIFDIEETKNFVNKILGNLEDDEVYILLLNARKKWCSVIRSEEIMDRDLVRDNDIDKILRKIKKIGFVKGVFVDRETLSDVPINCYGLYCLLDPRSTLKGYGEFISTINKWIYESFMGDSKNLDLYRRIDIKLFSAIHKKKSRGLFFVIDIDKKDEAILDKVTELLAGHIEWVSETHGGYHVIVKKIYDAGVIIYKQIVGMEYVEILKDPMTPIPGTLQGGFKVVGIRKELWNKA